MASAYCYAPLANPHQEIRILKLNPSLDNGSVLIGSLTTHTIPLRNARRANRLRSHLSLPAYFAISYVWGTGSALEKTHEVIVDGRYFPITANLHAALQQSRATTPMAIHFWVDAICINQADDEEKSAQVPLMRDIYHLALSVIVWLGKATEESDRVLRFVDKLTRRPINNLIHDRYKKIAERDTEPKNHGQQRRPLWQTVRSESERLLLVGLCNGALPIAKSMKIGLDVSYNALQDHIEDSQGLGLEPEKELEDLRTWCPKDDALKRVESENFHEMAQLLEKTLISETDYFNRMWTLQEVCVGSSFWIPLRRGTYSCSLEDFTSTVYYLQRKHGIAEENFRKITQLMKICLLFNDGQRLSLRNLLYESRGRFSENPRDKIYALQGLMKDEMNSFLKPDYTNSVAQVYANAARHMIYEDKSLNVLCGHQLWGRIVGLPSWTPDFRHFGLETASLLQASGENILYRASRSEIHDHPEPPESTIEAWETLQVSGMALATISRISGALLTGSGRKTQGFGSTEKSWVTTLTKSQEWTAKESEALKTVSSLVSRCNEFYHDTDRATFWTRSPDLLQQVHSLTAKAYDPSSVAVDLYSKYLLTLLCGRTALDTRCTESELESHMARASMNDEAGIEATEKLCRALEAGMQHRRLIVTTENEIGAAPEEAMIGDLICVLVGCSVPVVLRKVSGGDEYLFVGECYFYGYMDGEALDLRDKGMLESRKFTLQ